VDTIQELFKIFENGIQTNNRHRMWQGVVGKMPSPYGSALSSWKYCVSL